MADSSRKSPVVPPEVRELIEESQKIQGWVERLAEHADEARPEVYRRVLSDYQGRLEKITDKLLKHRTDLVSSLEEHEARVTALDQDRDAHAAELEEARLRHVVGEYSDDEWEERRGGIEDAIAGIDERLDVEREAVTELSAIIASIGEGGTPAVEERAPAGRVETPESAAAAKPPPAEAGDEDAGEAADEKVASTASAKADDASGEAREAAGSRKGAPAGEPSASKRPAATKDAAGDKGAGAKAESAKAKDAASKGEPVEAAGSKDAAAKSETPRPSDADEDAATGEYLDELEFLESLSLDEAERFDAVSAMLDEDEAGNGKKEG